MPLLARDLPPDRLSRRFLLQEMVAAAGDMLLDRELVAADEIAAGHALHAGASRCRAAPRPRRRPHRGALASAPRASPRVQGRRPGARQHHPTTHTRLPRYVRGHVGMVERVIGCHVFPEFGAWRRRGSAMALHGASSTGRELWGGCRST